MVGRHPLHEEKMKMLTCCRFVEYQFVKDLFPPNASYEQTNVFLYASAASVIGAIIFSKGAPYRKPLYSNGKLTAKLQSG